LQDDALVMEVILRRLCSLIIVISLVFGLTACGSAGNSSDIEGKTDNISVEASGESDKALSNSDTSDSVSAIVADADDKDDEESAKKELVIGENLLSNGDFHNELTYWGKYLSKGGSATFSAPAGEGKVTISNPGKLIYSVQIYYDGFSLEQGGDYTFSFDISSTVPRSAEARIQINGSDYHAYVMDEIDITEETKHFSIDFTMTEGTDPAPRLCFNLGRPEGVDDLTDHVIRIDNVSLVLNSAANVVDAALEDNTVDINLNQVGFLPDEKKIASGRNAEVGTEYNIIDVNTGKTVYSSKFIELIKTNSSREDVAIGDFSDFTTPGRYKIVTNAESCSYEFEISDDVYDELLVKSFLFLYSQRCGMDLNVGLAGDFAHEACHTGDALIYGTNKTKKVTGGWHDAGDYGRYVVPGAVTVEDLFLSYEDNKSVWDKACGDNVGIPESGNGVPDILDEARYELEWMLMMQDDSSGGVYHKITGYEFPGFVMPEEETTQMVLAPVSNTATGDFAAIMAKASRVYADYDSAFAASCLSAAKKAWKYLEAHTEMKVFKNPDDIVTGEYPDVSDADERLWASVELYLSTGDDVYKNHFDKIYNQYVGSGYGWAQIYSYANRAYLSIDVTKADKKIISDIHSKIKEKADILLDNVSNDGYGCSLGSDYSWGSNMTVANNGRILLDAYSVTGEEEYAEAAKDQLDYLLGRNTLSMCFVTGFGSLSPVHVHHRPSMATGYVFPGMLVGGPDSNGEDPLTKVTMKDYPPAKYYVDSDQSFSTNEVTIYWNSPFLYLLSYEMQK